MRFLLALSLTFLAAYGTRAQQPELFADIVPGPESSNPWFLGEVNGRLIVSTQDEGGQLSLWSLAGESLTLIDDTTFEDSYHRPRMVGIVSGRLVYAQYLEGSTTEQIYWSTDGENVVAIDTLTDANDSSFPHFSRGTTIGETMYFAASTPEFGSELWASDGLTTWLAADISPGLDSSSPQYHVELDGQLLFAAETPDKGRELWTLNDGTPHLVRDINPGEADGVREYGFYHSTAWGSHAYFSADDGVHGYEPWRTDGQSAELIADVNPDPEGFTPYGFTALESRITFVGYTDEFNDPSSPQVVFGYDGQTVHELFNTNTLPGEAGTYLWRDFAAWGDTLLFLYNVLDPDPDCSEAFLAQWSTEVGAEIVLGEMSHCYTFEPGDLTPAGDRLYFRAYTSATGTELGIYDGTTARIHELVPGSESSHVHSITPFKGAYYFVASTPETGSELWVLRESATDAGPTPPVSEATA